VWLWEIGAGVEETVNVQLNEVSSNSNPEETNENHIKLRRYSILPRNAKRASPRKDHTGIKIE